MAVIGRIPDLPEPKSGTTPITILSSQWGENLLHDEETRFKKLSNTLNRNNYFTTISDYDNSSH